MKFENSKFWNTNSPQVGLMKGADLIRFCFVISLVGEYSTYAIAYSIFKNKNSKVNFRPFLCGNFATGDQDH